MNYYEIDEQEKYEIDQEKKMSKELQLELIKEDVSQKRKQLDKELSDLIELFRNVGNVPSE